jgi:hypothetical protein
MAVTQPITTKPWHNTGEVQETWKQRCKDFDEWAKKIYQSVYNKPYTTKTIRKKKDKEKRPDTNRGSLVAPWGLTLRHKARLARSNQYHGSFELNSNL